MDCQAMTRKRGKGAVPMRAEMNRRFIVAFYDTAVHVHRIATQKGFWEGERNDGELIALIHSELSEALEAIRNDIKVSDHIPEFSGLEEELADAIIRIMDLAEARKLNVAEAIIAKIKYNVTRPHKHGKKF